MHATLTPPVPEKKVWTIEGMGVKARKKRGRLRKRNGRKCEARRREGKTEAAGNRRKVEWRVKWGSGRGEGGKEKEKSVRGTGWEGMEQGGKGRGWQGEGKWSRWERAEGEKERIGRLRGTGKEYRTGRENKRRGKHELVSQLVSQKWKTRPEFDLKVSLHITVCAGMEESTHHCQISLPSVEYVTSEGQKSTKSSTNHDK